MKMRSTNPPNAPGYNRCNSTGIIFAYHTLGGQRGRNTPPPPFKGENPKQTRGRGKPKGKPQGHRENPPKAQEADKTYAYDSPNNYYHNDNYTAPSQNHAGVLSKPEDTVVEGPITRVTVVLINISITHMINR